MQAPRISIDGLWRCLCPSFDVIATSRSSRPLGSVSTRPGRLSGRRSLQSVLSRSINSSMRTALEKQNDAAVAIRHIEPSEVLESSRASSNTLVSSSSLEDASVKELYDILRDTGAKTGASKSISELVEHLVNSRGEKPSLVIYDALIRANADASLGSAYAVATLLQEVKEGEIIADSNLYHSALQALAIHPDHLLRSEVMREMKDQWFNLTNEGWHHLIVGFLRDRQYEMALDKLEQMQQEGIPVHPWLYDIFIYLFCEAEELDEALKILEYRVNQGDMDISGDVWHHMLDVCSANYHYQSTNYVWRKRVEIGYVNPSDGICINVLNTAARHKDPNLGTDVIRVLTERNSRLDAHHYEGLISAYANADRLKPAIQLLTIMNNANIEPTEGSTRPIFESLSRQSKSSSDAFWLVRTLSKIARKIPTAAVNVMIEICVAQGELKEAVERYKHLHEICDDGPNTATFNAILQGCSKGSGNKDLAMFMASEMAALGVHPDVLTYDRLILVCLTEDDYEDAFRYLEEMEEKFEVIGLRGGTFAALVKKCVSAGDKRAWSLLDNMQSRGRSVDMLRKWAEKSWKVETTKAPLEGQVGGKHEYESCAIVE